RSKRDWSSDVCSSDLVVIGLLIGLATVLIPNPIFARDIAPVWWNYPVWIISSVVTGMLVATYVRDEPTVHKDHQGTLGMVGDLRSEERRVGKEGGCEE